MLELIDFLKKGGLFYNPTSSLSLTDVLSEAHTLSMFLILGYLFCYLCVVLFGIRMFRRVCDNFFEQLFPSFGGLSLLLYQHAFKALINASKN